MTIGTEPSLPRAKRRARVRELARVQDQQDLFTPGAPPAAPARSRVGSSDPALLGPQALLARIEHLRVRAHNHARMQREHARAAALLLAEALRLEETVLQLALPLTSSPGSEGRRPRSV